MWRRPSLGADQRLLGGKRPAQRADEQAETYHAGVVQLRQQRVADRPG
jgi:hypothetical protein